MIYDYSEKIKILPDGKQYEVELPWNGNFMNLRDNQELTWKIPETIISKLKYGNILMTFNRNLGNHKKK